jgi:hypothetical protein
MANYRQFNPLSAINRGEISMPTWLALNQLNIGVPAILLFIFCVLALQTLTRRILGKEAIRSCHDVSGHYLAIVGTFTAVLLGLVLVDAMTKFQSAEKTLGEEASDMMNVYSSATNFPDQANIIHELSRQYINTVIEEELPMMEFDQVSKKATDIAYNLTLTIQHIEPETENQKAIFPLLIQQIGSMWEDRRDRTTASNYGIPEAEWIVLILASSITIIFTFFFTIDNIRLHLFMTGLVSLLIATSLYLILMFGTPFSGTLKVSSNKFYIAQNYMK